MAAADGWPRWTCAVQPGREHDLTAAQADPDLLPLIDTWVADGRPALADLGDEDIPDIVTLPIKTPRHGTLTADQRTRNRRHNA